MEELLQLTQRLKGRKRKRASFEKKFALSKSKLPIVPSHLSLNESYEYVRMYIKDSRLHGEEMDIFYVYINVKRRISQDKALICFSGNFTVNKEHFKARPLTRKTSKSEYKMIQFYLNKDEENIDSDIKKIIDKVTFGTFVIDLSRNEFRMLLAAEIVDYCTYLTE